MSSFSEMRSPGPPQDHHFDEEGTTLVFPRRMFRTCGDTTTCKWSCPRGLLAAVRIRKKPKSPPARVANRKSPRCNSISGSSSPHVPGTFAVGRPGSFPSSKWYLAAARRSGISLKKLAKLQANLRGYAKNQTPASQVGPCQAQRPPGIG